MQIGGLSNCPNMWCSLQLLMKWQRSLFVADVSSNHNGSGKRSFFGGESITVMEEGAATMSRGRRNLPWNPCAVVHDTMEKAACWLRKLLLRMRRLRACLLLKTLTQQLLTFSLLSRDGWKILIFKLQVTNLEWSAWPPAAAPIWDLFEVWPPPTPEGNMCHGCSQL